MSKLSILKLSAALFYGVRQHLMRKSAGNRRLRRISRTVHNQLSLFVGLASCLTYSALISQCSFCLFFVDIVGAWIRVLANRPIFLFLLRALVSIVSPCASASEIFIPTVAEQSFHHAAGGPVNIASSVIHRRFAILSLRVVSRSRMAAREWINAATDGDGFEFVRIERT